MLVKRHSLFTPATCLAAFSITALLNGCGLSTETPICPAIVNPAIVVEVRDSRTGAPLAGGAQGAVHDGSYVDSLKPYQGISPDPSTLISLEGALGRPGEYSVELRRSGDASWSITGIRATRGECGVSTAVLRADLIPTL